MASATGKTSEPITTKEQELERLELRDRLNLQARITYLWNRGYDK